MLSSMVPSAGAVKPRRRGISCQREGAAPMNFRPRFISPFQLSVFFVLPSLALLMLAASAPAWAQVDRAVLEGTVSDPAGRVISAASVRIVANDTGLAQEQPANSVGSYRFPGL